MSQLFTLQITDGVETADFLSSAIKLANAGFNIGSIRDRDRMVLLRPGPFYVSSPVTFSPRKAEIIFDVRGATRSAAISELHKIRRILRRAEARSRHGAGNRVELKYAWTGSDKITYFEIYSGIPKFADDVMSVEKIFRQDANGTFIIPDCSVEINISPMGYGVSLYGDAYEIPLKTSQQTKRTGGVLIRNARTGTEENLSWAEIEAVDIEGSDPFILKIVTTNDTLFEVYSAMYIGLKTEPYPTKIVYEDNEAIIINGTPYDYTPASGGTVTDVSVTHENFNWEKEVAWQISDGSIGNFFAFLHGTKIDSLPSNFHFSIGFDDSVTWKIRYISDFVLGTGGRHLPLGQIQIPPGDRKIADLGNLHEDLHLSLFVANELTPPQIFTLDAITLLPIDDGFRIWVNRGVAEAQLVGDVIDDAWIGELYRKSSTNKVSRPVYPLLKPITLEPGINQRLYFNHMAGLNHFNSKIVVKCYVVPTYSMQAV